MKFTEEEIELGKEVYLIDKDLLSLYAQLIHLLKWSAYADGKLVRFLLGNFRELVGQDSKAYKYCVNIYNDKYCACGIVDCPDRKDHIITTVSRKNYMYDIYDSY